MPQSWVKARSDFSFGGRSYTAGQVVAVDPLVAVQMKAKRLVDFSKPPSAQAPLVETVAAVQPSEAASVVSSEPPPAPPNRPIWTRKPVTKRPAKQPAPAPVAPDETPSEGATLTGAVEEVTYPDANTYARKDLRADE